MYLTPYFSIIIPAFEAKKYIIGAIDSVLSQSFKYYEIIIVDDGSTDGIEQLIKQIDDDRIVFYRIQHSGTQNARYFGIKQAKGEYLIFLDADDYLTPKSLNNIYSSILKNPCDLYIGGLKFYDNVGICHVENEEIPCGYIDKQTLFLLMVDGRKIKTLARKVIRKEIALYSGHFIQNHTMEYGEDMFYSMDVLLSADTIYVSHDIMYEYVLRTHGAMNRFYKNKFKDRVVMYQAIHYYGELLGIDTDVINTVAEIYITKYLSDCLIEIDSGANNTVSIQNEFYEEKEEIVEILKIHSAIVSRYPERFRDEQKIVMEKYEVYSCI